MKKYFYTFSLTLLLMIASIAFLKRADKNQFLIRSLTNRLTLSVTEQTEALNENNNNNNGKSTSTNASNTFKYNYKEKYKQILSCNSTYSQFYKAGDANEYFTQPAPQQTHDYRMTRAVLVYFPIDQIANFKPEFKWMYRSWIEMQKNEPKKWRTDLVVFINKNTAFDKKDFFLNGLNCTFTNRRSSPEDKPMCSLVEYVPLKNRKLLKAKYNKNDVYNYLLNNLDIFSDEEDNLAPFYDLLKLKISHYGYLDSILMAFDGYAMLKKAGYNFLIRSDMDVFLTPFFGQWLPRKCDLFHVGRGGYSSKFNENRLRRIANDLGFKFANQSNLGSTWYSNVDQFRLVSYLTLVGMVYVSEEEFSPPEREGKNVCINKKCAWILIDTNIEESDTDTNQPKIFWAFGAGLGRSVSVALIQSKPVPLKGHKKLCILKIKKNNFKYFKGKLGVLLWPYWHYGVLLLYGQNLALNHLIATNSIEVIKLFDHLDYPAYYSNNVNTMLVIHVFHGDDMFSKFQFKAGKYDNLDPYKEDTNIAKYYSLKMALEGKRLNATKLNNLLNIESSRKT